MSSSLREDLIGMEKEIEELRIKADTIRRLQEQAKRSTARRYPFQEENEDDSELRHDGDVMQDEDVILLRALRHPDRLSEIDEIKSKNMKRFEAYMRQAAGKYEEMEFIGDRVFNLEMSLQLTEGAFRKHKHALFSVYTSNKLMTSVFMDWGPTKVDMMASDIEISCGIAYLHGDRSYVTDVVQCVKQFGEMTSEMSATKLDAMESLIRRKESERHSKLLEPSVSSVRKIDLNSGPSPFGLLKNHFTGVAPVGEHMEQIGVIFECTLTVQSKESIGRGSNKKTARDNAAMTLMRALKLI